MDENFINNSFLHRVKRKVRFDRTIKLENIYYEVPFKYVNQTIEIRYNPLDLDSIYIFENDNLIETCKPVDKVSNSKVKRKEYIDYSKVINDERDVIEMTDENV